MERKGMDNLLIRFERFGDAIKRFGAWIESPAVQARVEVFKQELLPGGFTHDLITVLSPDCDLRDPENERALEHVASMVPWKLRSDAEHKALADRVGDFRVDRETAKLQILMEAVVLARPSLSEPKYIRRGKGVRSSSGEDLSNKWIKGPDGKKASVVPGDLTGAEGLEVFVTSFFDEVARLAEAILMDRSVARSASTSTDTDMEVPLSDDILDTAALRVTQLQPLEVVCQHEKMHELNAFLRTRAPKAQQVFALRVDRKEINDIAAILDMKPSTVRVHLHKVIHEAARAMKEVS